MAPATKDTITVACPACGNRQREPRTAYSTLCRKCGAHFRLEEALRPPPAPRKPAIALRQVRCFDCGAELEAPAAAASTMCKKCSSYVDLGDYEITQTVSKNFRTYGRLVIAPRGYVLNTNTRVGDAVIKGKLIGKLVAERTLEIHSTASIKGTFSAGRLVVPAGQHFRWMDPLDMGGAEIVGELVADLRASGTVLLRQSARFFGRIEALNLVVEAGAVFVGTAKVGLARKPA